MSPSRSLRGRLVPATALALFLAAGSGPALAWTDPARAQIVRDATKLMPESLRELMRQHERDLLQGMLQPGSAEDQPDHWQHPDGEYGTAAARAEKEAEAIIGAVNGRAPFAQVVRRFGVLAHMIADVNDPLHAADRDPMLARYYADYEKYMQQQMPHYPLVFQGYRAATLSSGGPASYLMESAGRSREYARFVRKAYDENGNRVSAAAFDTRSLAFGIGSLSYSHAVNDIARVWLWAWEGANGDMTRMPYPLDPSADKTGDGRAALEDKAP